MVESAKRPFWLHQIAEFVIAVALIGSGLQSPDPVIPAILGGLVLLNAVTVDGPLGAFRFIGRKVHRVIDIVLLVLGLAASVVPGSDLGTRIVQLGCFIVFATVVFNTKYTPAAPKRGAAKTPVETDVPTSRSDEIGRTAGRVAGTVAGRARAAFKVGRDTEGSA